MDKALSRKDLTKEQAAKIQEDLAKLNADKNMTLDRFETEAAKVIQRVDSNVNWNLANEAMIEVQRAAERGDIPMEEAREFCRQGSEFNQKNYMNLPSEAFAREFAKIPNPLNNPGAVVNNHTGLWDPEAEITPITNEQKMESLLKGIEGGTYDIRTNSFKVTDSRKFEESCKRKLEALDREITGYTQELNRAVSSNKYDDMKIIEDKLTKARRAKSFLVEKLSKK